MDCEKRQTPKQNPGSGSNMIKDESYVLSLFKYPVCDFD